MQQYLVRRLVLMLPVLFLVSGIVFVVLRMMPGDVAALVVEQSYGLGPEDLDRIREELGLNAPLYAQYCTWVWDVVQGDLGKSLWTGEPAIGEIARRIPVSAEITVMATLVATAVSIPAGVFSAIRKGTVADYVVRFVTVLGLAVPHFWLGLIFITFAGLWFHWIPPIGFRSFFEDPWANMQQLLPAALILGFGLAAILTRMIRSTMLEVLRQDYVRTAWSKGLKERTVVLTHALRNSLIPSVTLMGAQIGRLLGGTVIIETVFAIPGFGRLIVESISQRDYPLIQANVLVVAVILVVVNLLVDIAYAYIDPRIRYK